MEKTKLFSLKKLSLTKTLLILGKFLALCPTKGSNG